VIRRINLLRYVRRYQWLLGAGLLLVALFVLAHPPIPKGLNYSYQLSPTVRSWPLVAPTAGLVEWSTERVREVYRWNLTAETVARAWPPSKAGTPDAVLPATVFILLGVAAVMLLWFAPGRRWVGAGLLVLVVAGSLLGSNAKGYTETAAIPSVAIPEATVTLVTKADPGHTLGVSREAQVGLKDMADRYWEHYVTFTKHRMGSAGSILATPKRVWFGISGLMYVLPFAFLLGLLSTLATVLQTLGWALTMAAPFGFAIALIDGRAGVKVKEHVVLPWVAVHGLLVVVALAIPLSLWGATAVHAIENEVGLLLIGSIFPLLFAFFIHKLTRRNRKGGHRGPRVPDRHSDTRWAELLAATRHR
jgi:hypothetical protein